MVRPWYGFNITQGFGANGEKGVDLGTPYGTPITALYGGTVLWAGRTQWSCGSSGGEVTILCNVPGYGLLTSYYLHLDSVAVKPGDKVPQGSVIGHSGGQLKGGNWPVVNCPSKGDVFSNGPHTEFGFNAPWVSGPGKNIDPTFAILQARSNTLPIVNPDGSVTAQTLAIAGIGGGVTTFDPTVLEQAAMQWFGLSATTQKVISQPEGFDGIVEAIDAAEQFPVMNWANIPGTIMLSIKPILVRWVFMFMATTIMLFILWEWVHTPAEQIAGMVGRAGLMAAAPEAAPAIAATAAPTAKAR